MPETPLTLRDLLLPGEPLDPAEVLSGHGRLSNPVSWVVSLRPYPPAFPRLRGGEIALVPVEHLSRLDPPTTLADVVRHLDARGAAGAAVRGEVDAEGLEAAAAANLPLLKLLSDAPLTDIEQAIMRECALYQARQEVSPRGDRFAWIEQALDGTLGDDAAAQEAARASGFKPDALYVVACLGVGEGGPSLDEIEATYRESGRGETAPFRRIGDILTIITSERSKPELLTRLQALACPCGIGSERSLLDLPGSLAEAQLALTASRSLYRGAVTVYNSLGAARLLLLLHRDDPQELRSFVEGTLGPLLRHDARSASPLLPTVQAFVGHNGRLRETAAGIFVHRNTLAYRLDRAAEILNVDLKDAGARLAIELALVALPLVDV